MKAKIDKNGYLEIERAGKFKSQRCPFSSNNMFTPCGDMCPLFHESYYSDEGLPFGEEKNMVEITLCTSSLILEEENFVDEREKSEKKIPKTYIILLWFWEENGYLITRYLDCYSKKEDAIEFAMSIKEKHEASKVYLPGEEIPKKEDGEYGSKPFIQVVEVPLKKS